MLGKGLARWALMLLPLLLLPAASSAAQLQQDLIPAVHILQADDRSYRLAADGGYKNVVQVFTWRDIQPAPDEWHWQQPDFAVRAADYYDLGLIVRLDQPPDWALEPTAGEEIAPIALEAYVNFARMVARRYRGQIEAYIVWNEPNLSREWAGQAPNPAAYRTLLCQVHKVIKAADPDAKVVSAGLAPTNGGDAALDDRVFLEALYEAGAGACFDVMGVHAYGFGHPPDDPHGAHDGLNLARLADLRDIMETHDAGGTPVWITELGWTTDGKGADAWQTVSTGQQADYLMQAWRQIKQEWPWVQMATVWNLSHNLPATDEMAGYSLLATDGSPRPAYHAMRFLLATDGQRLMERWLGRLPTIDRTAPPGEITILAPDEVVHLGDNQ